MWRGLEKARKKNNLKVFYESNYDALFEGVRPKKKERKK